jgi:hypothetical protein
MTAMRIIAVSLSLEVIVLTTLQQGEHLVQSVEAAAIGD